jgi:hypothetical protein
LGAPQDPGAGGVGAGGAGAGAEALPAGGVGAGSLGGGVVEGVVSPVLFVPFEDAGERVGAGVCERCSGLSSGPSEQAARPAGARATTAAAERSRLKKTGMSHSYSASVVPGSRPAPAPGMCLVLRCGALGSRDTHMVDP